MFERLLPVLDHKLLKIILIQEKAHFWMDKKTEVSLHCQ